jgi:hypothetical protein
MPFSLTKYVSLGEDILLYPTKPWPNTLLTQVICQACGIYHPNRLSLRFFVGALTFFDVHDLIERPSPRTSCQCVCRTCRQLKTWVDQCTDNAVKSVPPPGRYLLLPTESSPSPWSSHIQVKELCALAENLELNAFLTQASKRGTRATSQSGEIFIHKVLKSSSEFQGLLERLSRTIRVPRTGLRSNNWGCGRAVVGTIIFIVRQAIFR